MRFALVDNKRVEAEPGLNGLCPVCSHPVVAKCGDKRINHLAHRNMKNCDSWWESETEWHRTWKNIFPSDWQEVIMFDDETGEKHIADVRTEHGLVIEFQHSKISQEERISREKFHKNMIWVVDGTRLKRDYPRLIEAIKIDFISKSHRKEIFKTYEPEYCFNSDWIESSVPVFIDFQGLLPLEKKQTERDFIWCILPGRAERYTVVARVSKKALIKGVLNSIQIFNTPVCQFMNEFTLEIRKDNEQKSLNNRHTSMYNRSSRRLFKRKRHYRR